MSSQSQKFLGSYFQQQKPRGGPIERKRSKLSQANSASGAEEPKDMRPQGAHDGFVEAELDVRQTTGQEGASLGSIGAYGRNAEDDEMDPAEQMLREFDLDYKYGPCLSTTRLERWERAQRLGLNPPKEVKQLLDAGERAECLWAGRV